MLLLRARPLLQRTRFPLPSCAPQQTQLPSSISSIRRTMASSSNSAAAPLQEWLVIAPDHKGALEKRLSARPQHLEGLKADHEKFWLFGGAMLEEPIKEGDTNPPKMSGSVMLIGAKTKEEVVERLKRDKYVTGEVWDWEKVQIFPFKSALRKPL
ncbi:unnamed protein product [Periconia digitata]|uniref:YCII-related domain-containing protein n=1 Tax=Periconia digitata TaxID=1303443 RepID=A0A9W4XNC8_9PLEO|nr:unnamed protein product [Periconia digitata]